MSSYQTTVRPTFSRRYGKQKAIGRGSLGVVFSCYDRKRREYVACKTVAPDAPQRHYDVLEAEAALLKALDHPNILPLYDISTLPDGRPYYTMKRVQGETLEDAFRNGSLTLTESIDALMQVCDALDYAHSLGVIHCDLKPGNILRDHNGHVYLIDWGTSETSLETTVPSSLRFFTRRKSKDKYIVNGTPLYIAPEVLRGEAASPQADQYALGVIMYELLTGAYPFYNDNVFALFQQACCTEPVAPHIKAPGRQIPVALETFCLRLLTKFAHTRYKSCQALKVELQRWLSSQTRPASAPSPSRRWFAAPA